MEDTIYVLVDKFNNAILKYKDICVKACIGINGITKNKKEGDGKTLVGEFGLGIAFGIHDDVVTKLDYVKITDDLYWVDDVKSIYYNKLVNINEVDKDWESAEHLIDYNIPYEYAIEIKANPNNIRGKGSAIFLHSKSKDVTRGCISIENSYMLGMLKEVNKDTKIIIKRV